ncbi:MAG: TonB-dependent receptor [Prevotellaceae bacterium]|jgi:outer membrane receptor protein involved in Fe transport|nr:TonB-dependent receptor [Prevotellaceae bacterium]
MQNKFKLKLLLIFLIFCSNVSFVFANDISRKITGYVTDAKTSEPIAGVVVLIKGTNKNSITDTLGYYSIKNLENGKYTLVFSYISYKTIEIECDLKDKDITDFNISMESDIQTISEAFVKSRTRSNTENSMISTIKTNNQVVSGISSAQITKNSDKTASEVIRRIPGITVIDERFIIVRGLSPRYNNVWLNGLAIPGTESDSRAFPFDLIPSSQIDNLLIYKSPAPEIPGDFSGGFVKITSKGAPNENRTEISYSTGFNVKTQFNDFHINPGSSTDFLGFDLSKRTLSENFPKHLDAVVNPSEITRLTTEGFNNDWRIKNLKLLPDQHLSLMFTRRIETKNNQTIGNITAFTYSNTFKSVEKMKNARYGIYSGVADMPVILDDYIDNQFSNDARLGLLHNWSLKINPANTIEFKNLLNILGSNRLTERTGIKDMSSMYYREQTEMRYSSRLTYSGQFSGIHDLSSNQTLTWDVGYSYANKNEPDRRIVSNQAGIGSIEDIQSVTTINDNISRYFQNLYDNNISTAVNYKKTFTDIPFNPTLKTGIYGEYNSRSYSAREFTYRYDNLGYEEKQTYLKLPFQEMLKTEYLEADKVYIDEITRKTNNYSADVWLGAAYLALEIPLNKFNIYSGIRLESRQAKFTRDRSDAADIILMTSKNIKDIYLLPSINMTYKFTDKHQIRAAYGRSINRPELRELSPTVYFDFDLFNEIGGNENLKTAVIDNFDLRYEFYPNFGETVSLGVFYKRFRNPIEWTFIDMGGSLRYNYENADKADSWGMELDIRKNLDFIGLPNFSLILNAALIKSKVHFKPGEVVSEPDREMQGQSPYVINAGLYYQSEKTGINFSLLYNLIGKRIIGLGKSNSANQNVNSLIPNSYEMPRNVLDFIISKTIGKKFEIRCSVKDILSENITFKQFPKFEKNGIIYNREQITRQYKPGQSVSLGVLLKIN